MGLTIAGKTDKGKKRSKNEDTFLIDREMGLMIVADGMGGHNSGEVASQLATRLCSEQMKRAVISGHVPVFKHVPSTPEYDQKTQLLGDSIKFSNLAVYEAGHQDDQHQNMGTTLVAALWLGEKLAIANVGDSRLYLVRDQELILCTTDHSFVQEQIDKGLITAEDAAQSDFKNMLTRSVGVSDDVQVDLLEVDLIPNDFILLCSDGLTKMVSDKDILKFFEENKDPESIAIKLIQAANMAGGLDNITVVVAHLEGHPSTWKTLSNKVKGIFSSPGSQSKQGTN